MKWLRLFVAVAVASQLSASVSVARPGDTYEVEFAILPSMSFVREIRECYYEPWDCEGDRSTTVLQFPGVAPAIRFTAWGSQPLLFDLGITLIDSESDRGYSDSYLMVEGGFGVDVAKRPDKLRPFAGIVGGVVSADDPLAYLGAQGGIRYFIRDYTATRLQLGYRATIGREPPKYRSIELACGLSFFL